MRVLVLHKNRAAVLVFLFTCCSAELGLRRPVEAKAVVQGLLHEGSTGEPKGVHGETPPCLQVDANAVLRTEPWGVKTPGEAPPAPHSFLSDLDPVASDLSQDPPDSVLGDDEGGERDQGDGDEEEEDQGAFAIIRYTVPPAQANQFRNHWMAVQQDTEDAFRDDVLQYDLKKTQFDNLYWLSYAEFARQDQLQDHLASRYWADFDRFTADSGIKWEVQVLRQETWPPQNTTGRKEEGKIEVATDDNDVHGVSRRREEDEIHVLTWFVVPPGLRGKFVREWNEGIGRKTAKKKGTLVYSLKSLMSDNQHFYSYGSWKGDKDYQAHQESKYAAKWHKWVAKHDVTSYTVPLLMLGATGPYSSDVNHCNKRGPCREGQYTAHMGRLVTFCAACLVVALVALGVIAYRRAHHTHNRLTEQAPVAFIETPLLSQDA